ncbi:MAG: hypothetical protein E7082_03895 [Bacteroidales bacterium]|nr:hypothetical protein [Bacteroidales bacterium]
MQQRLGWLDYSKTIAIYLVILGHTAICPALEQFIYVFHMPLFFFMAGYVFKFEKQPTYRQFLKKNTSQLLLPYLLLNCLTFIFWLFISSQVGSDTTDVKSSFHIPLIAIFYGHPKSLLHDIPLWFILALFVIRNLFYILYRNSSHTRTITIIVLLAAIIIYTFEIFTLPLCLDIAIIVLPIYALGYYARVKGLNFDNAIVFGISLIILVMSYILNGKVAIHVSQYNNLALFYMGGIAGCYAIIFIAKKFHAIIGERKLITFIATNTLLICAFHLPSFTVIKGVLLYVFNFSPDKISGSILPNILLSLISLCICLILSILVNKYTPILSGYRTKQNYQDTLAKAAH